MISTVRLWETLMQGAKAGSSGYQNQDEFNRDLAAVQTDLMGIICPFYAKNIYIQDMIAPFVNVVVNATEKPADYFQFVSAEVNGYPAYPLAPNQKELYATSPIRKPTSQLSYYIFTNNGIDWLTESGIAGNMTYIRNPKEALIVLTPSSEDDSDYITPTSGADLEWPDRAFNFILLMMQQRLGLEMDDSLQLQFSQVGIQTEASKVQ